MAIKYHLVLRKNMSRNVAEGEEQLYYAQTRATRTCTFEELCELIAESSTASSGDVKLVVDRMLTFMAKSLERGEVVQLGELGNFQFLIGSSGSVTADTFQSSQLRKARLCFRPGTLLRTLAQTVKGERMTLETTTGSSSSDSSTEEKPDEL